MAHKNNAEAGSSKTGSIAYDPDQDPEERRDIRKKYRDLRAEIEGMYTWRCYKLFSHLYARVERQNNTEGAAEFLLKTVKVADSLFDKGKLLFESHVWHVNQFTIIVKGTGEATLDSELLVKASVQSAMLARAMKSGSGAFDVDDYVAKLVIFMGGRHDVERVAESDEEDEYDDEGDGAQLNWERIGWKAMGKSHRVPVMDFM